MPMSINGYAELSVLFNVHTCERGRGKHALHKHTEVTMTV